MKLYRSGDRTSAGHTYHYVWYLHDSDLCTSINTEVLAQKGPAKRRALRKYEVFVRVHRSLVG
jgi:hypothetical protein